MANRTHVSLQKQHIQKQDYIISRNIFQQTALWAQQLNASTKNGTLIQWKKNNRCLYKQFNVRYVRWSTHNHSRYSKWAGSSKFTLRGERKSTQEKTLPILTGVKGRCTSKHSSLLFWLQVFGLSDQLWWIHIDVYFAASRGAYIVTKIRIQCKKS